MVPPYGIFPPCVTMPPCTCYDRDKTLNLHVIWLRLFRNVLRKGLI